MATSVKSGLAWHTNARASRTYWPRCLRNSNLRLLAPEAKAHIQAIQIHTKGQLNNTLLVCIYEHNPLCINFAMEGTWHNLQWRVHATICKVRYMSLTLWAFPSQNQTITFMCIWAASKELFHRNNLSNSKNLLTQETCTQSKSTSCTSCCHNPSRKQASPAGTTVTNETHPIMLCLKQLQYT